MRLIHIPMKLLEQLAGTNYSKQAINLDGIKNVHTGQRLCRNTQARSDAGIGSLYNSTLFRADVRSLEIILVRVGAAKLV